MFIKTTLLAFALCFALTAAAAVDLKAQLEANVDIDSAADTIQDQIQALVDKLSEPLELCLFCDTITEIAVKLQFDTTIGEDDTFTFEGAKIDEEGAFKASLQVDDLAFSFVASLQDLNVSASVATSFVFSVEFTADYDDGLVIDVEDVELNVEDLSLELSGLDLLQEAALSELVEKTLEKAFDGDLVVKVGDKIKSTVEGALKKLIGLLKRVSITLTTTLAAFNENRKEIVEALIEILKTEGAGDFEGGLFIAGVSAEVDGQVAFDFFLFDNKDGDSGNDAADKLLELFEEDSEVFADQDLTVSKLSTSEPSGEGDSDSATALTSFLF